MSASTASIARASTTSCGTSTASSDRRWSAARTGTAVRLSRAARHAERLHDARGNRHVRGGDAGRREERAARHRVNRRAFLHAGTIAAAGYGLSACAPKRARPAATVRRPPPRLVPVNASWDRVIRTTVGLRPHRDPGFVLRPDKLDDKLLVHNYGHGGAGMSLSWGTGLMAAELPGASGRNAAVVGCGSSVSTTARELQRRGFDVTIYTAALPPDVTSNCRSRGSRPPRGVHAAAAPRMGRAIPPAVNRLSAAATDDWPGLWHRGSTISPRPTSYRMIPAATIAPRYPTTPGGSAAGPGEHPFPTRFAMRARAADRALNLSRRPVADFRVLGGKIVFASSTTSRPRGLARGGDQLHGARRQGLFGDPELVPLKGQLSCWCRNPSHYQPTADRRRRPPGLGLHMMPRRTGLPRRHLQRDIWTLEPDEAERKRIVEGHIALFSSMKAR